MRICIVATSGISLINFRGELIRELVKKKHEVFCVSIEPEEQIKSSVEELGAKYYQVYGSRTGIGVVSGLKMISAYKKMFQFIKPDICYLYMSKPIAFGGYAAVKSKVPHINILVNGLENAYYRHGVKDFFVRKVMNFFYRYVSYNSDNVFIQNYDDYMYFVSHRISRKEKMVIVGGSGVDMSYYIKTPMPRQNVVLMTARLLFSKGIREFLAAIPKVHEFCPDVKFILVGGCDDNDEAISREQLQKYIDEYDIVYEGYTNDVRPYLNCCSIYVLPSYHEGLPRSVLEAMAVGRPIITTDVPGCKETVIDGKTGFIVPARNSDVLADRIIRLCRNRKLCEKMAEASYQLCKEKFDVKVVNQLIMEKMNV